MAGRGWQLVQCVHGQVVILYQAHQCWRAWFKEENWAPHQKCIILPLSLQQESVDTRPFYNWPPPIFSRAWLQDMLLKGKQKKRKFTLVLNWQHWHGACHRERSGGQGPELSWDGRTKWKGAQMSPDKPSQKERVRMFGKRGSHPWDCPPVQQSSKSGGADSCNCAQQNSSATWLGWFRFWGACFPLFVTVPGLGVGNASCGSLPAILP